MQQLTWRRPGHCSPCPSNSLSWPFRQFTPSSDSQAPFSGIPCFPGIVVGGGASAGVHSWRHSCTRAPDAPHAWGKAPHQTEEGNSCRQPARPRLSPAEASPDLALSVLQGLFAETNTISNFSTLATSALGYKETCHNKMIIISLKCVNWESIMHIIF